MPAIYFSVKPDFFFLEWNILAICFRESLFMLIFKAIETYITCIFSKMVQDSTLKQIKKQKYQNQTTTKNQKQRNITLLFREVKRKD